MRRSEATDYMDNIKKPAVSWLELCYGDKRFTDTFAHGMGYTEEDLEKAGKIFAAKRAAEVERIKKSTHDGHTADTDNA